MDITINGKLHMPIDAPYLLDNGRKCQRIIIITQHNDPRFKTDYFGIFLYGDAINQFWKDYNFNHPNPNIEVKAKLNGRMKNDRNTITLSYKSHKHY